MELNNFLVVHDPTREEQPALERAAVVAEKLGASLHLFGCIHGDVSGADKQSKAVKQRLGEHKQILEAAAAPVVANGVSVSTEVEWDKDWYHAVVRAAARNHADIVYKSSYTHSPSQRILKSTSDWTLIRECLSPVLLIKDAKRPEVPVILAAIDISVRTEAYEKLNNHIMELGRRLLESDIAEIHVVNAFPDFRVTPDPKKLIEATGLDKSRIHIKMGPPDRVIVETANKLNANMVVVGNSHRSGLAAMMHGNTAEKILDKLDCNVLAMP
ncbi:MAG: universal stress protein [Halioglobus sp.]